MALLLPLAKQVHRVSKRILMALDHLPNQRGLAKTIDICNLSIQLYIKEKHKLGQRLWRRRESSNLSKRMTTRRVNSQDTYNTCSMQHQHKLAQLLLLTKSSLKELYFMSRRTEANLLRHPVSTYPVKVFEGII